MRNALKGALLSALVWPGLGQIVLKRYVRGVLLICTALAALTLVVVKAVQYALAMLSQLDIAAGPPDIQALTRAALATMAEVDRTSFFVSLAALVICWLVGVADAWRVGARMDREPPPSGP